MDYIFSILTREGKETPQLSRTREYVELLKLHLCYYNDPYDSYTTRSGDVYLYTRENSNSIYEGHAANLQQHKTNRGSYFTEESIFIMMHDDVTIETIPSEFERLIRRCLESKNAGFVGVAGACHLGKDAVWWNARNLGKARGFVFQGNSMENASPNLFGPCGQVVVLDGLFMACKIKTLLSVGLEKPPYLTSNWDFYDINLTLKAHQMGYNNFTVPIITCHASPGNPRAEWVTAREQFIKQNSLPVSLNYEKTNGLPN
jgi:Glycosyltransferase like family